jgi:hypothetical protein
VFIRKNACNNKVFAGVLERGRGASAFLLTLLLMTGCSYDSEVKYEAPESQVLTSVETVDGQRSAVSLLQRIVMLPVAVDANVDDPKDCMNICDPARDRTEIALSSANHLEQRLSYEVVCLDFACRTVADNPYTREQLSEWAEAFGEWAAEEEDEHELPPHLLEIARQIESTFDADGLMVVHGRTNYVTDAAWLHWMVTLTASMYYQMMRGDTADLQADIYTTSEGTKLWSVRATVMNIGQEESQAFPVGESKYRYAFALFGALDPHESPPDEVSAPMVNE